MSKHKTSNQINKLQSQNSLVIRRHAAKNITTNKLNAQGNAIESRKSSVQVYLRIKKVRHKESKDYFHISNNSTEFALYDEAKKTKTKDTVELSTNYILEEGSTENLLAFENVCRNSLFEVFQGQRMLYLTYGLTKTGKKSLLFGEENSKTNINSRGLIYRFVDKMLYETKNKQTNISIYYNFYCNLSNKVLDFSKLLSITDLDILTEQELMAMFEDIKLDKDYENEMNKTQINEMGEFMIIIQKVLTVLYKLEVYDIKVFSRSSLILNVQLYENDTGNKTSNVCFCAMSAAEMKSSEHNYKMNKIKYCINVNSDSINLIQILKDVNKSDFNRFEYFNNKIYDSFLVYCLKNNFEEPTNARIIGCVFPAPFHYSKVLDTVMVLKRIVANRSDNVCKFDDEEENKDDIIYDLSNKVKTQEKTIDKLKDNINEYKTKINNNDIKYKDNLELIKKCFNFEGDIIKLSQNDNHYSKESQFARKIRDCLSQNKVLQRKLDEKDHTIKDEKNDKERIQIEKTVLENDKAMVMMYNKIKENNITEEKKLKILLDYNKEKEHMKKLNEQLISQNENLRKEMEDKNKQYKDLPDVLKNNNKNRNDIGEMKRELKSNYDKLLKYELRLMKENHAKELSISKNKAELLLRDNKSKIRELEDEVFNHQYSHKNQINKFYEELMNLNDIILRMLKSYRQTFDMRKVNLHNVPNGLFIKIKESLDKQYEELEIKINKYSYPLLFNAFEAKQVTYGSTKNTEVNELTREMNLLVDLKSQKEFMRRESNAISSNNMNNKNNLNIEDINNNPINPNNPNTTNIGGGEGGNNKQYNLTSNIINNAKSRGSQNNKDTMNPKTITTKSDINNMNNNNNKTVDNKSNNNNNTNDSNEHLINSASIEEISMDLQRILPDKKYKFEELEVMSPSELTNIVKDLQAKILEYDDYYNRIKNAKRGIQNERTTVRNIEIEKVYSEIAYLKKKLERQVESTRKYKMIAESQERMIDKYKNEQFYKLEKDKIDKLGGLTGRTSMIGINNTGSRIQSGVSKMSNMSNKSNSQVRPTSGVYKNVRMTTNTNPNTNTNTNTNTNNNSNFYNPGGNNLFTCA